MEPAPLTKPVMFEGRDLSRIQYMVYSSSDMVWFEAKVLAVHCKGMLPHAKVCISKFNFATFWLPFTADFIVDRTNPRYLWKVCRWQPPRGLPAGLPAALGVCTSVPPHAHTHTRTTSAGGRPSRASTECGIARR